MSDDNTDDDSMDVVSSTPASREHAPEWYFEEYALEVPEEALRTLLKCLVIRVAETDPSSTRYAAATSLRESVESRDPAGGALVSMSGGDWSNAYGALYTVEFGAPPARHDVPSEERLEAARDELRARFPEPLTEHVTRLSDGMDSMLSELKGGDDE